MIFNDVILDSDSCNHYAQKLLALKSKWIPHGKDPLYPYFHTMGIPIYMDSDGGEKYKSEIVKTNPLLNENFDSLYNIVIEKLKTVLKAEKILLSDEAALPGFHIYAQPMPNGGSIHLDNTQIEALEKYFGNKWDAREFYSFTLCLELPETGAGIKIWNDPESSKKDFKQFNKSEIDSNEEFTYVPYKVGGLFVMKGEDVLHQIAPNKSTRAGERRTTLQGHLIRHNDGHLMMYW